MHDFNQLANDQSLQKTKSALEENGFQVIVVNNSKHAKTEFFKHLPIGAAVMENTSKTLDDIGVTKEINESGKYVSLHNQVITMDRETEATRIKEIRSAPDYAAGSFHAVTENGHIMMASGSGSQIPGYAYGASHVIFVAGTQKIVKDLSTGFKRIYEYSLPLGSVRINKVYNMTAGSAPRRILIMTSERDVSRTTVILVKENLGF